MTKVCVITGSRAEYGLLYWTMKAIENDPKFELNVCVTGMHLSPEFDLTYKKIELDGFNIDGKVEMLLSSDTSVGISKSVGLGVIGFADYFDKNRPDLILVLGDRIEIFSAVSAAMIARIPIAHCHGGECTEGLIDEAIRHSITKMSHIHFTSTNEYRKRVIQLGENPNSVFNVGALGIENINKLKLFTKNEFENKIKFKLSELNFLVTFHPVSLEINTLEKNFNELLKAISCYPKAKIIFTKPNSDHEGRTIVKLIDKFVSNNKNNSISFISLGQKNYLSAIKHCNVVIGNSSSGIIEAPSFYKPTINIGDRQKGRVIGESVISCHPKKDSIVESIDIALSKKFTDKLKHHKNPYGKGNSSKKILEVLNNLNTREILKKEFYNTPNK